MLRVLTWNIQRGGGRRLDEIAECITSHDPDVIVLTEYGRNLRAEGFLSTLAGRGWEHHLHSEPPKWSNGVLIAARLPISSHSFGDGMPPARERWLGVEVAGINLTGIYFPLEDAQPAHWDHLLAHAPRLSDERHIITGDFNTGRHWLDEDRDVLKHARYIDELEGLGWQEGWRRLHPEGREYTWYSRVGNGFRLDHAFLSPALLPRLVSAEYSHKERASGVSDHSVLLTEFEI